MFKEFWRCYLTLKCLIIASLPMLLATVKGASFDMIVGAILPPWSWTKELFTSGKLAPFVTNVQGKQTCILYRPLDAAALSMTYVVVYSLDLYVVCRLIYLFVSGLYSLACFHLLDLARESIQLQRIFLALVGQKFHRAKVEGLTSNKRPILELKDVSFRCVCFFENATEAKCVAWRYRYKWN